ncbi:MAG: WXG100 family type VII secretion target, partial [Actinophytocola sp.]|uniref:WXG100 family type VII secretion target n=1 Tax=Actinophytocola sp. TaxID=1872138 RepID=UPI003D6C2077
MSFDHPDAVAAMTAALSATGDGGDCWDVIGKPLDDPVDGTLHAYDDKLSLNLLPSGTGKRLEIAGLRWGRIEKDVARLVGLADAVDAISKVVRSGRERLAHDWRGEAHDAFRVAIEQVEKTLDDYSAAVRATAAGLATAIKNIRTMYLAYRDECTSTLLDFSGFVPPEDWLWIGEQEVRDLKSCASCVACDKENVVRTVLLGQALQRSNYKWFHDGDGRDHEQDAQTALTFANQERSELGRKINEFYAATDALKKPVGEIFEAALENLRKLAEAKVFSSLGVPGERAAPAVAVKPAVTVGPAVAVESAAAVEPAVAVESAVAVEAVAGPVLATIKNGNRTISVTSPDGEGHVRVTVGGGVGRPRSYHLDFDAASELAPRTQDAPGAGADPMERVLAATNGQCVIKDGPLTITAERPLFDPGKLTLEVDDGVNEPTTHAIDLDRVPTDPEPKDQVSTPASVNGEVAAGLVPDQSNGEAKLASAGEGEPAGVAGAAAAMLAGA